MLKFNGGEGDGIKVTPKTISKTKKFSEISKEQLEKKTTSQWKNVGYTSDYSIDPKYLSKTEQAKNQKPTVHIETVASINNAKMAFEKAAKSTKELNDYLTGVNTKVMSDDYIFTVIKPEDPLIAITRRKDNYFFGIYQTVKSEYNPSYDQYSFDIRVIESQEYTPINEINTKIMRYVVTAQVMNSANKSHLRHMIVQGFANEMSKVLNLTAFEAEVVLNNILKFKDLPGPEFNGTLYHNFAKGGYVKDGGLLPKGSKPLNKPKLSAGYKSSSSTNLIKKVQDSTGYIDISNKSKSLPGITEKVPCPLGIKGEDSCGKKEIELWGLIQHINDDSNWTREQIADWLDSLADDGIINIDFPIPEDMMKGHEIGDIIVDEIQEFLKEEN